MTENEKNEKLIQDKQLAFHKTFKAPLGKKVLDDLEIFCGFMNSSQCETAPDALQTAFNEGKRRVYLRILGMIAKGKEV